MVNNMLENERLELLDQIKWLEAQVEALELELSDARKENKELSEKTRKLQEAYSNASWSIENGRW